MKTLSELIATIGDDAQRQELITLLTNVIEDWLVYRTEELFGKLYRLDISEKDIKKAMTGSDFAKEIAALIYERQIQKYISRKENPASKAPDDLKW